MIQITCSQVVNTTLQVLSSLTETHPWNLSVQHLSTDAKKEAIMTKAIIRECTFTLTIKGEYLKKHSIEEYASWARQEIKNVFNTGAESSVTSPNSLTIKSALSKREFNIAINLFNAKFNHVLEGIEAHQEKKES